MASETSPIWVIDPNGPAELVHRMQWDHPVNRVVGLFPERLDLTDIYRILEIGCGAGEWTLDAAHYFPVSYVGLDTSSACVAYAQAQAKLVGYDDLVSFEQTDLSEPLPFADASFDLVHVRFLVGSLPTMQWPGLLHETWRVLTPRGYVLFSEADWPSTNSTAMEQFVGMMRHALYKAGYGLSRDGQMLNFADALPALLQQHGWYTQEHTTHALNFSCGSPLHEEMMSYWWATAHLMQPFLTRMGYGNPAELSALCEQIALQGCGEEFVGTMTVLQAWGQNQHIR